MFEVFRAPARRLVGRLGLIPFVDSVNRTRLGIPPSRPAPVDIVRDQRFVAAYEQCAPFTMTSIERMYALYQSVVYVVRNKIPGDFAECGVWRGGSSMLMALALRALGDTDRQLYLYDTFEGMTAPSAKDRDPAGLSAADLLQTSPRDAHVWAVATREEVEANLRCTGYPFDRISFVQGPVERTIPAAAPRHLAVLRLDTDWYESTRHELKHLYPRLRPGGVLLLDDYGYWQGAREAVDAWLVESGERLLLHRIDEAGRIAIKGG